MAERGGLRYRKKHRAALCALRLRMIMTVMQFRQVRVIMAEGQVPVKVGMGLVKDRLSIVEMIVVLFVPMNVVVFYLFMRMRMCVMPAEE